MDVSAIQREAFLNPRNIGEAPAPSFVGRIGSFDCGAVLHISIRVDDSQRIVDARFKAAGCSTLIAAASLLTEHVKGMTTGEAARVTQLPEWTNGHERNDCAALSFEALRLAIQQYSGSIRSEWEGDEALICTCFGVSESRIEKEIESKGLTTIVEVTRACNAGAGCRSCYSLIEELLRVKDE